MVAKGVVRPERLPPTLGAAEQHSIRAYLQIHDWMALECTSLDPTNLVTLGGKKILMDHMSNMYSRSNCPGTDRYRNSYSVGARKAVRIIVVHVFAICLSVFPHAVSVILS